MIKNEMKDAQKNIKYLQIIQVTFSTFNSQIMLVLELSNKIILIIGNKNLTVVAYCYPMKREK